MFAGGGRLRDQLGTYFYSMDAKNRLAVPVKFRLFFNSQRDLILSQGLEGCLNLYSLSAWSKLDKKLESMPLRNKIEQRALKRLLFSSASEVQLDEEGRILIPQSLVYYAQLRREVAIIGLGEKAEIWAKHLWEKYQKKQRTTLDRHAAQLEL